MTDYLVSPFEWSETAGRYRDLSTGRFVSERVITARMERVTAAASDAMEEITGRLLDDQITLPEWRSAMQREISDVNRICAAVSKGWQRMTPSDWGFAGSWIKKQYRWLDKFARELASGKQPMNRTAITRARMYGQAGRGLYQEMRRRGEKKRGKTEEMRVLGPNENHCESTETIDGCIELAGRWAPIGTLPPIGESPCYTNCKCQFRFR